ncbi:MAG: adenosylcobinamide-phosphate synthase CbiB [Thermodesulfobacteriota bacterium]|nr:adenosylcobinamide-phosphate synthase CbiB [Thermodesulfobacteriota bacterium]
MFDAISWYILFFAYILDFAAGDPRFLPHPVVGMGKAIEVFEILFRKLFKNPFTAGLWFAACLIFSTWVITAFAISFSLALHPVFGAVVQIILLFFCFSGKSLEKAAIEVENALENNELESGRNKVAMIVGREVKYLDHTGVVKAATETVAENFVDGFLSPLCFALVGGVPLAMAYKMINTLDSMVGYKNEKYILFGRVAAKIDDIANYIPARISLVVISFAAGLLDIRKGKRALLTGFKDGRLHKSPNAGYPEAAFAGALKIRLGGPNYYHGTLVEKPYIGSRFKDPESGKIKMACDLMLLASFISIVISCLILY